MGTGGSRYGAGRPGWRRKCELSLPLDIRRLHRKKLLQPGTSFGWHWTSDGEPCGNIGMYAAAHYLELSYTRRPNSEHPQSMRYNVPLEYTPCRYGGSRPWFRCPWCNRRCALIYGLSRDGYFGCRLCLRLAYASEAESPIDRCWRQQRKIEAKLAEEGSRPKGMHTRTYSRLCEKWDAIEQRKDDLFLPELFSLAARLGMSADDLFK